MPSVITTQNTAMTDTGGAGGTQSTNTAYLLSQQQAEARRQAMIAEQERLRQAELQRQAELERQRQAQFDAFRRAQSKKAVVTAQIAKDLESGKIDPISFSQLNPDIKKVVSGQTANIPLSYADYASGTGRPVDYTEYLEARRQSTATPQPPTKSVQKQQPPIPADMAGNKNRFQGTNVENRVKPFSARASEPARDQVKENTGQADFLVREHRFQGDPNAEYEYTFNNSPGVSPYIYEPLHDIGWDVAVFKKTDANGYTTGGLWGRDVTSYDQNGNPIASGEARPLEYFVMRTNLFTDPERMPASIPRQWAVYMTQDGWLSGVNTIKGMESLGYEYNFETDSWELPLYGGSYSGGDYGYDDSGYSYSYGGGGGGSSSDDKENEQRPEGFIPTNWRIATG